MPDVAAKVLDYWTSHGVRLARPLARSEIERRLTDAGLPVGSDFVDFLAIVGGMENDEHDQHCWSVWKLDRLLDENREGRKDGVFFSDWLLNSYSHLLRKESDSVSSIWVDYYDANSPTKVAESLENFLERYLCRDEAIAIDFDL